MIDAANILKSPLTQQLGSVQYNIWNECNFYRAVTKTADGVNLETITVE